MEQGPQREMDGFARIGYPEPAYHLIDQNGEPQLRSGFRGFPRTGADSKY
jgi:hypothetical protein